MDQVEFKSVDLYGGAFSVTLPKNFNDLSEMLPVSDNQEVYTDFKYDAKLIIEILECLEPNDEIAVVANFNEVSLIYTNRTY